MNRYSRWLVDETHVSDRMRLKLVANSLISSTKIGTVQACYFLLNLPTVKLSRTVENFNPLHRDSIRRKLKVHIKIEDSANIDTAAGDEFCDDIRNPEASAVQSSNGIGSLFGKRDFYGSLVTQQKSLLNGDTEATIVSLFSLLTSYSLVNVKANDSKLLSPPFLTCDENGLIQSRVKCKLGKVVLVPRRQHVVVNMSPSVPIDNENERSAYATLLMHVPWEIEEDIIKPELTAVIKLRSLLNSNFVSPYVRKNQERTARSQSILNNQGTKGKSTIGDNDDIVVQDGMYFGDMENDVLTSRPLISHLDFTCTGIKRFDSNDRIVYKNFINQQLAAYNILHRQENQIDEYEGSGLGLGGFHEVPKANERRIKLQTSLLTLKELQLVAYKKVVSSLTENTAQLIMFLTGEGTLKYSILF